MRLKVLGNKGGLALMTAYTRCWLPGEVTAAFFQPGVAE
jgi:hypothetical protein